MLEIMILFGVALYILVSVVFVKIVKKMAPNNKRYRRLALALVVLLPTWDIILGCLVYYPACYLIPKTAVYETAITEGMYIEGENENVYQKDKMYVLETDEQRTRVGFVDQVLARGFDYMEAKVTQEGRIYLGTKKIPPVIYRCVALNKDKYPFQGISCVKVNDVKSRYMVKVTKIALGLCEVNFIKIIDRSNSKVMAVYREVVLHGKDKFISFIDATRMSEGGGMNLCCPEKTRLYDFQYDVLKPKQ